jgi:hypothetical protein
MKLGYLFLIFAVISLSAGASLIVFYNNLFGLAGLFASVMLTIYALIWGNENAY